MKAALAPNYVMKAKCTRVLDGDTVVLTVSPAFKAYYADLHFRLFGINAPELKADDPAVRAAARRAKDFLTAAVLDQDILIQTVKTRSTGEKLDKYGRYLATIFVVGADGAQVNLNKRMVELGLAVPFME